MLLLVCSMHFSSEGSDQIGQESKIGNQVEKDSDAGCATYLQCDFVQAASVLVLWFHQEQVSQLSF
jgi:hypothetical protein